MIEKFASLVVKARRPRRARGSAGAGAYVWLPDGEVRDVSATPGSGYFGVPSVHPAGREVVFHGGADEHSRIWRADLEIGETEALTPDGLVASAPSYDHDGSRIVFAGYERSRHPTMTMNEAVSRLPGLGFGFGGLPYWMDLYVLDLDGGVPKRITSGWPGATRPSFSPEGRTVVFLRRQGRYVGRRTVWGVAADGSSAPEPILPGVAAGRPITSVDGQRIYFSSPVGGRVGLASVPAAGGAWDVLENDTLGGWSRGPFPDPDGEHLWYHCGIQGGSLCKLHLSGGSPWVVHPPGFEDRWGCAHVSVSRNGVVAFDWVF